MLKSKLINIRKINKKILINFYKKNDSFVIKPNSSGSSYGVIIIKTLKDIDKFFQKNYKRKIYKEHKEILIEKFVKGKELTVTVIEENKLTKPVEVTEINYKNKFFDYKTKYNLGLSKHIIPANLSLKIYKKCLKFSKIAHDTIGCNGITRTDLILDENTNKFVEVSVLKGGCKLQWKVDWAMRWVALEVDYEMCGKDLSESVNLGKSICSILDKKSPFH